MAAASVRSVNYMMAVSRFRPKSDKWLVLGLFGCKTESLGEGFVLLSLSAFAFSLYSPLALQTKLHNSLLTFASQTLFSEILRARWRIWHVKSVMQTEPKKSSFDLTCNVTDSLRNFVKFRITNLSTSLAAKKRRKMDSAKVSGADCAPRHLVIHGFPKCSTFFRPHFSLFQHPLKGIQTAHLRSSSAGFGAGQGWAKAALTPLQSCKPRSSIQSKQS